jgi:hypothetical protein
MESISDQELLEELKRLETVLSRRPQMSEWLNKAKYPLGLIYLRFGHWVHFLDYAGYELTEDERQETKRRQRHQYEEIKPLSFKTEFAAIKEVRRIRNLVGHTPTFFEFNLHSVFKAMSLANQFGEGSYPKAIKFIENKIKEKEKSRKKTTKTRH